MQTDLAEPYAYQELPQLINMSKPFPVLSLFLVACLCAIAVIFIMRHVANPYEL